MNSNMESLNISYDNLINKQNNLEENTERTFTFKLENIIQLMKEYELLWNKNITNISKNLDGIKTKFQILLIEANDKSKIILVLSYAERNDDEASIPSAIQIYTCRGLRNEQNSLIKALTEIGDQFYYILIYCLYYNKIF
ncbi:hypothetical protein H8356DRAFT_1406280 [Neocallimastix lanati (nom. inval.)]|nr:hypothetical protein H8356DRAFT_1406280 [Neocallimastix sp. JGI-2020a]